MGLSPPQSATSARRLKWLLLVAVWSAEIIVLALMVRALCEQGLGDPSYDSLTLRPAPDTVEQATVALALAEGRNPLLPIVNELHPSRYSPVHPFVVSLYLRLSGDGLDGFHHWPLIAVLVGTALIYVLMIVAGVYVVWRLITVYLILSQPGFITVSKDEIDWPQIKPAVLGAIMEHYMSGAPVLSGDGGSETSGEFYDEADAETVTVIKELIETRVRPAVANDGGDITFQGYKEGVVYLHMRGACAGCPSSTATLKHGIENLLKHFVPGVQEVRPV